MTKIDTEILNSIPESLRKPLLDSYNEIITNYLERRWEPAELNGGKFCEVVYSIITGALQNSFPSSPSKPLNMVSSCRALEQLSANPSLVGDRSFRILIPRMLQPLYEIRNNRNVGHVGGEVDPNYLDATAVYSMSSWILAEMIRIFHNIPITKAQETVDALIERKHPIMWEIDGVKRVLDPSLSNIDQTLLILYSGSSWLNEKDLFDWVEHDNLPNYRRDVLTRLHKQRLVEYNKETRQVHLSPKGTMRVEEDILYKYI